MTACARRGWGVITKPQASGAGASPGSWLVRQSGRGHGRPPPSRASPSESRQRQHRSPAGAIPCCGSESQAPRLQHINYVPPTGRLLPPLRYEQTYVKSIRHTNWRALIGPGPAAGRWAKVSPAPGHLHGSGASGISLTTR